MLIERFKLQNIFVFKFKFCNSQQDKTLSLHVYANWNIFLHNFRLKNHNNESLICCTTRGHNVTHALCSEKKFPDSNLYQFACAWWLKFVKPSGLVRVACSLSRRVSDRCDWKAIRFSINLLHWLMAYKKVNHVIWNQILSAICLVL